ncbi:MAG: flavodoxin family protein [Verrucomicrobia bacterium]|nr:MAG: flavodoxin family protein [Verrucomicrobiota bacterium]
MKAVAFNGSVRPGGNTEAMLRKVLSVLEAGGVETELVQVGGIPIRGCRACGVCKKLKNKKCVYAQDIVNDSIAKIDGADAVIFGSPSYFMNVTSEMKAFIDRVGVVCRANGGILRRKVGAAVSAQRRAGADMAIASMNCMMLMSEMYVVGSTYLNMGFGLDKGDIDSDAECMDTLQTLGENILYALRKFNS